MHADLMCPASLDFDIEQCETIEAAPHLVERQRASAATHNGHPRSITRVPRQRFFDPARIAFQDPMYERKIRLENLSLTKLISQMLVRSFSLCHCQQTRGVFVEPVHNAGTNRAGIRRKLFEMISKCVGESASLNSGCRMYYQTCGFVDDNQRIVFKDDVERDVLRNKRCRWRRDQLNFNLVVCVQLI